MTDLPNVAFMGKAGSGKTTAAEALVRVGYERLSFAAPLKEIAVMLWGEAAAKDREKLQRLGQFVRELDPDTWVNLMGVQIVNVQDLTGKPVVVDDLRFPNEHQMLKELGFTIIRIEAPRMLRRDRLRAIGKLQDESQLDDTSEMALDDYPNDATIENVLSPEEFGERLNYVLKREQARV